ncbi:putative DNA polymerase epsilon catalytic subunit A [Paratrimastix pyriformis]|uniref:DNA polymerase epsilon catalytic subunit n=1 Tax=Paratrimastix pyriformis TaxID=342808 RepID=A0ABQ8UNM0_9EUKA|nr:putative DNA polymerase epsilon catalytic subunit A [Paratrimastix pyriformis]
MCGVTEAALRAVENDEAETLERLAKSRQDAARNHAAAMGQLQAETETTQQAIAETSALIDKLQAILDAAPVDTLQAELDQLRKTQEETRTEVKRLLQEQDETQLEERVLQGKFTQEQTRLDGLQAKHQHHLELLEKLKATHADLESERGRLQGDLDDGERVAAGLVGPAEVDTMQSRIEALKSQIAVLTADNRKTELECSADMREVDVEITRISTRHKQAQEEFAKALRMQAEEERLRTDIARLEGEVADQGAALRLSQQDMAKRLAEQEEKLRAASGRNKKLPSDPPKAPAAGQWMLRKTNFGARLLTPPAGSAAPGNTPAAATPAFGTALLHRTSTVTTCSRPTTPTNAAAAPGPAFLRPALKPVSSAPALSLPAGFGSSSRAHTPSSRLAGPSQPAATAPAVVTVATPPPPPAASTPTPPVSQPSTTPTPGAAPTPADSTTPTPISVAPVSTPPTPVTTTTTLPATSTTTPTPTTTTTPAAATPPPDAHAHLAAQPPAATTPAVQTPAPPSHPATPSVSQGAALPPSAAGAHPANAAGRSAGQIFAETVGGVKGKHPNMKAVANLVMAANPLIMMANPLLAKDGSLFRASMKCAPYFYVGVRENMFREVENYLRRKFEAIHRVEQVEKEDLAMSNHLSGLKHTYLKLLFRNVSDLKQTRDAMVREIVPKASAETPAIAPFSLAPRNNRHGPGDFKDSITEIREGDVPYIMRVSIDKGPYPRGVLVHRAREEGETTLERRKVSQPFPQPFPSHSPAIPQPFPSHFPIFNATVEIAHSYLPIRLHTLFYDCCPQDLEERPEVGTCAFDIETTKAPLKFPDENVDQVMMISYMMDGQGYLIINRTIVAADIPGFDFTPKPEYPGPFIVFNEPDERALLLRWFAELRARRPSIFVTFNGDSFDWPFIEARTAFHGMNLYKELGFKANESGEFRSRFLVHMDCFRWVKRDSYLPQGSQGLKAVTRTKLGYDPLEIDPEDMTPFAREHPQQLANYSVSDAVSTWYLYRKYVHPFIFSLANIIPLPPDDVLRKGSGGLCESLLMPPQGDLTLGFHGDAPLSSTRSLRRPTYRHTKSQLKSIFVHSESPYIFARFSPNVMFCRSFDSLARRQMTAYGGNIICPPKTSKDHLKWVHGHLLESETYIGGHVESLASGVYRCDLPHKFRLDPPTLQKTSQTAHTHDPPHTRTCLLRLLTLALTRTHTTDTLEQLLDNLDRDLEFALNEDHVPRADVKNYDEVREQIARKLMDLRDTPNRLECPVIYHLDVAAMYPNIILTNRLQPPSIVSQTTCAGCDFNTPESACQRKMSWMWRGELIPATVSEYRVVRAQLEVEKYPPSVPGAPPRTFFELDEEEQATRLKKRLQEYSRKAHKKGRVPMTEERQDIVCQRENSFYVDTVRAFRDRRYEYKGKLKTWKGKLEAAQAEKSPAKISEAQNMLVLYDSLQLAHKCILNSFYGYVMRTGSRWYSMEMAGIGLPSPHETVRAVGHILGSDLTHLLASPSSSKNGTAAERKHLVERIGQPLELDTDGIWCALPRSFPERFQLKTEKKSVTVIYPCVMLNADVKAQYSNHQYQTLVDPPAHRYELHSECSILFEVDGPYLAMVLPSSRVEGKSIKKRYAVFNKDRSLAELKGFELKRRGELRLIKVFQSQIFDQFLEGKTLEECYAAVGKVANQSLDLLYTQGRDIEDSELLDLLSETHSMSKALAEYGGQKSTTITTAERLAEFLGEKMVKDKGLACSWIVSKKPLGNPVSERAVPAVIFSSDPAIRRQYLKRWLRDPYLTDAEVMDIRAVLDWDYYIERLGAAIQKIITIPAAFQHIPNPVPRVVHPDWLAKQLRKADDRHRQRTLDNVFKQVSKAEARQAQLDRFQPKPQSMDIEDLASAGPAAAAAGAKMPKEPAKKRALVVVNPCYTKQALQRKRAMREAMTVITVPGFERCPDRSDDPDGWLRYHKALWCLQRVERMRRRAESQQGSEESGPAGEIVPAIPRSNILRYALQTSQLMRQCWQVIKIAETTTPEVLRMWAFIDKSMHPIKLHVPYTIYINATTPAALQGLETVGDNSMWLAPDGGGR